MKNLICLLALVLCYNAFSAPSPFHPYEEKRFNTIETKLGGIDETVAIKSTFRKAYSFSNNATGSTLTFGTLPAYAVVTNSYLDVVTDVLPVNASNTFAVHCVAANDIFTATDISVASSDIVYAGTVVGGATAVEVTSAGCTLTGTIGGAAGSSAFASGKVILFVDYLLAE